MDSHMTEKILNLTLEIICLLTGERFPPVKSGDLMTITVPHFLTPKKNISTKIREVAKKITELLTGEVPIRCQDVSVYFSMKEWEYLEGRKDLYKDIVMMEDQPPLTSPDGFSKRNPPERCPRPQDSTQEDHNYISHEQGKDLTNIKVKGEAEEMYMKDGQYYMEKAGMTRTLIEEDKPEIQKDGSSNRNPPERCPHPLDSQETTQEDHTTPCHDQVEELEAMNIIVKEEEEETLVNTVFGDSTGGDILLALHDQGEDLINIAGEVEESYVRDNRQYMEGAGMRTFEEEDPHTESKTGNFFKNPSKKVAMLSSDCKLEEEDIAIDCAGDQTMDSSVNGVLYNVDRPSNISDYLDTVKDSPGIQEESSEVGEGISSELNPSAHSGEKPHSCSECGKCFVRKSELITHQRSHTGEKPYSCHVCSKSFTDRANFARHKKLHTGLKPHACPECGKCFSQKSNLVKHQRSHTRERTYCCPECGKCFSKKSYLYTHQRLHTGDKPYICTECGKCFIQESHLYRHQKSHTGEKPFSCPECGKCFMYKGDLSRHRMSHTGEKPFSCTECGKSFSQKSNLVKHQKSHTKESPYCCSECRKCFSDRSSLYAHQRLHTGAKPYSCSECGKCYKQESHLYRHFKSHTGGKPHACPECGKCFTHKGDLSRHQMSHTGEKPYACTECGKCFSWKSNLVTHQRYHTGDKPFSCSECGKCYMHKSELVRHQRSHTGEKPFCCPECGKCFSWKSSLNTHQLCHTLVKRFFCPECGECFSEKSDLTEHEKIHSAN